jgi:hypothetical protein
MQAQAAEFPGWRRGEFRCFFERGEFKRFVSLVINFQTLRGTDQ